MVCTRIAAVVIVLGLFGCAKPKLIPNTKVTDNKLNRDILGVVEQYRRAQLPVEDASPDAETVG